MAEIEIGDGPLEPALQVAFDELRSKDSVEARLSLPASVTPNHRLAETLRRLVEQTPNLRRVVLLHPSPGIRFVASSLTLLLPSVTFHALTTRDPSASASAPDDGTGFGLSVIVGRVEPGDPSAAIQDAFARASRRHARGLVLVLDAAHAVDRRLVAIVSEALIDVLTLELLVLVHPSPAIGLLASGLALRCPRVRVVPCATEDAARELVRRRMT